jgi:hypothetical protein
VTANELGVFREHGNSSTILKKAPWAVACDLLALQADFGFDEAPTRSLIRAAAAPTLLFRSHGPRLQLLPYEQGPSSAGAGDGGEFSPRKPTIAGCNELFTRRSPGCQGALVSRLLWNSSDEGERLRRNATMTTANAHFLNQDRHIADCRAGDHTDACVRSRLEGRCMKATSSLGVTAARAPRVVGRLRERSALRTAP